MGPAFRSWRVGVVAAAALVVLGPAAARAAERDEGLLPAGGQDLVRLDDGRTLRCRVGPKENGFHRLEFPEVSILAPASRVHRVLYFRDFDPEPRDDAEREKAARGLVRWAGQWYAPSRAAELRSEFLSKERAAHAETVPARSWNDRHVVPAGSFLIHSDLPLVRVREYGRLLEEYMKCLDAHLQVSWARIGSRVPVYVHRARAGFDAMAAADGGVGEHTIGYFKPAQHAGTGHIVLYDLPGEPDETLGVLLHEATHLFMDAANGRVASPVRPWLNEGLAEYLGGSEWKYGKFRPGALQEERLLWFQEMIDQGRVLPLEDLVRVVRWTPDRDDDAVKGEFGLDHYAQAWCFIHFLVHGRQTAYLAPFREFLRGGEFRWGGGVEALLTRLRRNDFEVIQRQLVDYARGLRLTGGRAYAKRALGRAAEGEKEEAAADLARAVERAGADAPTLVFAGRAARALGKVDLAAELLGRALELDPLDARLRLARAWCVGGEEARREALLAAALAPEDEEVAKGAEFRLRRLDAPGREEVAEGDGEGEGDEDEEGEGAAPTFTLPEEAATGPVMAAFGAALEGEHDRARKLLDKVGVPEDSKLAGLAAGLEALLGNGEGMAERLLAYREAVRSGEKGKDPSAKERIAEAIGVAAAAALQAGEKEECGKALDLVYRDGDPATEQEWAVWATVVHEGGNPSRARAIATMGLRALPGSGLLKQLRDRYSAEDR